MYMYMHQNTKHHSIERANQTVLACTYYDHLLLGEDGISVKRLSDFRRCRFPRRCPA